MPGHIGYPRTAAIARAEHRFRLALAAIASGAVSAAIKELRAVIADGATPAALRARAEVELNRLLFQSCRGSLAQPGDNRPSAALRYLVERVQAAPVIQRHSPIGLLSAFLDTAEPEASHAALDAALNAGGVAARVVAGRHAVMYAARNRVCTVHDTARNLTVAVTPAPGTELAPASAMEPLFTRTREIAAMSIADPLLSIPAAATSPLAAAHQTGGRVHALRNCDVSCTFALEIDGKFFIYVHIDYGGHRDVAMKINPALAEDGLHSDHVASRGHERREGDGFVLMAQVAGRTNMTHGATVEKGVIAARAFQRAASPGLSGWPGEKASPLFAEMLLKLSGRVAQGRGHARMTATSLLELSDEDRTSISRSLFQDQASQERIAALLGAPLSTDALLATAADSDEGTSTASVGGVALELCTLIYSQAFRGRLALATVRHEPHEGATQAPFRALVDFDGVDKDTALVAEAGQA